jgi:succinate dehydrogenase / fumarate reductase cytochrome b subunit
MDPPDSKGAAPPGKPRATEGPASRPGSDFAAMLRGAWLREVWASTVGKKVIVAISGGILALYVLLHAIGNLEALRGTGGGNPFIDRYAEFLRSVGGPEIPRAGLLWVVRAILLTALVVHVVGITQLYRRNRAARPAGHRATERLGRSLASRAMLLSGVLLLAFIVFHILQFTTGTIDVTPINEGTVYSNLYFAFQKWYFVLIYVVAVLFLGLHLYHALWSVTQTAGWDKPNRNASFRRVATGLAGFITIAFASVPILFWTGVLPNPPGVS